MAKLATKMNLEKFVSILGRVFFSLELQARL